MVQIVTTITINNPVPIITAFRLVERDSSFLVRFFENFVDSIGSVIPGSGGLKSASKF